ncbi:TPA: fimbrial biogenesis outer membrane usher protein [Klebsiella variicola subsp. variicola]|nr:fimbrial biogenesis outer membrane usher protein [Klebsiella variicola subsp. variicola]
MYYINYLSRNKKTSTLIAMFIYHAFVVNANAMEVQSDDAAFDPSFLYTDDKLSINLSRFSHGPAGLPGTFKTLFYVNDTFISNSDIAFIDQGNDSVVPCLTKDLLNKLDLDYDKIPAEALVESVGSSCINLLNKLPDASFKYDSNEQRLNISLPQLYVKKSVQGAVNPRLWDKGIPAFLFGYNANGYSSHSHGQTFNTIFMGVNSGLNVDGWYLRHNGSYSKTSGASGLYSNINTYLMRDIPAMRTRALAGQSYTSGELFDSLPFTGIQLATEDRMLPDSQRGYAPEIRGIARTNARVTVYQRQMMLYETTVPPGAFLINDLYPTGYGGDLDVTVHEADGSEQHFSVPYASVAQLLRPGALRYSVTVGHIRSEHVRQEPALYQATLQYGLTNSVTGSGGLQVSQNYYAIQAGSAIGTPLGAISLNATHASTRLTEQPEWAESTQTGRVSGGESYQVSLSKLFRETGSNISLAAYRFSTQGYMDFTTAMQTRDAVQRGYSADSIWRAKNRVKLSLSQGLPEAYGQTYVSGSVQNYWNSNNFNKQYQIGYNNRYKMLTYGINANRSINSFGSGQTSYLINFSLPLGRGDHRSTPYLRTDLTHSTDGRTAQQMTISGIAGAENQYNYGITATHANKSVGDSATLTGGYQGSVAAMNAALGSGKHYQNISAGFNGTMIGHSGGLTFTPYTSDTFALIEAKGADGAKVSSYPGIKVDSRGYAAVPYLNPYQMNEIIIEPSDMSANVELSHTSERVVPYLGSVVKVSYGTKIGIPLLVNATFNGAPVPFGADVMDSQGNRVGVTGQGGTFYARVAAETGTLTVKWGESQITACTVEYQLPAGAQSDKKSPPRLVNSVCR